MENRIKDLEIEVSYLKREIDTLKLMIMNQNGNTYNNTTNNISNIVDMPIDYDDEIDFREGFNNN